MNKRSRATSSSKLLFTTILVVSTIFMRAESAPNGYIGKKWAFLEVKQAMAAAAEITAAKYPDCDDATVDEKMMRVYRADGTGESQDETFEKVLTEKGARNNRTISLDFMLPYSTVEVVKVEVIRPTGEVLAVDIAANSKEMIDDSQMEMNIYDPNSKILKVNIPQLRIGDVVHSITRTTTHRSIIPGEYADENVFEGEGFLRHLSYEVEAPVEKPLKFMALRDEIPGTVVYSTRPGPQTVIHHWEVNNVPRMFPEPSMPAASTMLQRLLISTTSNWQAISTWYWGVCQSHLNTSTPEMKKTVEELTAGAKTDEEKIKAIFYYVSKKVRYMGLTPEKDRPGFEPHDVSLTFGNKYGVCRDKAALLVSMLRLAGVKAYPVLTNYGAKMDKEVPTPFFNHAIVGVESGQGSYTLMDPTDENTRVLFPSAESDQSYLIARPEGETILTSAVVSPDENMMRVKTEAVLGANGQLEAKSDLSFEGYNDNAYREAFSQMKPDDERRFFEERLKQALPGAKLKNLVITPKDMTDVSSVVHAEIEYTVDDVATSGGGKAIVNLPWIGGRFGVVNFILNGTGLEKRKYPMQTYVACGLTENISLRLGSDYTGVVSMPAYIPIHNAHLDYDRKVDFEGTLSWWSKVKHWMGQSLVYNGGSLTASRELKLKVVEFSPEDYLGLKETLRALAYDGRKSPVMAKSLTGVTVDQSGTSEGARSPVDSNEQILESQKDLVVTDAHTAVYHVRYVKNILTYNGKKEESEIKVDYNPAFQTAKIIHATVTSKTGERKEASQGEINLMDDSWNASAKRYTGGKILVANLPGVEVGSKIEVEYEISSKGAPYLANFEPFQLFDDLDHKSFQVTAPTGIKVQKLITGSESVREETTTENGQQKILWQAEKIAALPKEGQLPPDWSYRSGVQYFIGDLGEYLQSLHDVMVGQANKNTKAARAAKEAVAGAKTRLDAVLAIRDLVARSIRAAGPSFTDLPLSELSAADTTLSDGYGHVADQAILLYGMLASAGFNPEFVLASDLSSVKSLEERVKTMALPDEFSYPLVKVVVDGQPYFLNDTNQYAKLGVTPHQGKLAIDLKTQAYEVIQAAPDCQDKVETVRSMSLTDEGKLLIGYANTYYGAHYDEKKQFYSELPPEEERRYFQKLVSNVTQGARPAGRLVTSFDTYPGTETYSVEVDHYAVVDGKYMYFELPFISSFFPAGADHRALPLLISSENESTIRTEISLPPRFQKVVIVPGSETLAVPNGGGSARVEVTTGNGKCQIVEQREIVPAVIDPANYSDLLKVDAALGKKASKVLLLEKQ